MRKGYLTVYLSLTLAVMLSLILILIEGARISATRMRAVCVADIGINSTLSEYNRELLKQYDLIMLDMSYCGSGGTISSVNSRLDHYLLMNLDNSTPVFSRDLLGMQLDNSVIEEYSLATDDDAEPIRREVADYMDTTLKGIAVSGLDILTDELCNAGYDYDVGAKRHEVQSEIDSIGLPTRINDEGEEEEVPLNNPADAANATRDGGIIGIVLSDTSSISKVVIDPSLYVSNREIKTGNGIGDDERKVGRAAGKVTYDEYLLDKCGWYLNEKEGGKLSYQIEYIIKNKDCDWDNLEAVCKTILLWREAINFVYLMSDAAKVEAAKAVAAALSAVMLVPELEEPVAMSILLAWAYVEALQDLKILLEGDGVPVAKTSETWHTDITDIVHPRSALKSYPGQIGARYGDYLRTMLCVTSYGKTVAKSMDVMEMDIRQTAGNSNFKIDNCMYSFLVYISTKSKFGHGTELRRRSGYYY